MPFKSLSIFISFYLFIRILGYPPMTHTKQLLLMTLLISASMAKLLHWQSVDNNQGYLDALSAEEAELSQQLNTIQEYIKYLHDTLDQLNNLPDMQVVVMEDGLADEESMLRDMQQNLSLPLDLKK